MQSQDLASEYMHTSHTLQGWQNVTQNLVLGSFCLKHSCQKIFTLFDPVNTAVASALLTVCQLFATVEPITRANASI